MINFRQLRQNLSIKKIFLGLLAIAVIVVIYYMGRIQLPESQPQPTPPNIYQTKPENQPNTWNGITPGYTPYSEAKKKFGDVRMQRTLKDLTVYVHKDYDTGVREHLVGVDRKGIVKFISIPIPYDAALPFSSYEQRLGLGDADIVMYDKDGFYEKAHIYLEKGIWLNVFDTTQVVYHETYFTPMSKEEFMSYWGNRLEEKYSIPEDAAY
jgi:hypothetical protein